MCIRDKLKGAARKATAVCAVGNPRSKYKLILKGDEVGLNYVNLIHPNVRISQYVKMGHGNIICAGNILTVNIKLGNHVILNLDCTVGHDAIIGDYSTILPSVKDVYKRQLMFNGIANTVKNIWFNFKFDLIHAQVALPDGFTAVKLKQEYHVPVVVTIHGADLQNTIYRNSRCRQAIGEVLKKADHIITVSDKLKNSAIDNYGYKNKIKTIANGVHPFNINFKKETRINRKIMLSVSNLIQSKGIDLNLIAFSSLIDKHPTLIYKIIGDGPDLLRLKKIVKSLHIPKDRVFFLGQLSNREVLKHMSEADIFSLPSWREGFGIVYLEAMARGKPVIACKGEGIEDVIEHKINGFLVEPRDVDSLIRTIDYLLANPESAVNIGKIAQQVVLNRYRCV